MEHIEYTEYYHLTCISHIHSNLHGKYYAIPRYDHITSKSIIDFLHEYDLCVSDITKDSSVIEIIINSIVKKHYKEILDNIEGYIKYCKTEKIKIDIDKVNKFINFIKEYVKSIYGFVLI